MQPLLGLHGHIHEASGMRRIGRTIVINPGATTGPAPSTARSSPSSATRSRPTSSSGDDVDGAPARERRALPAGPRRRPSVGDVLVAIDVGTSGARAAAFDLEGRRLLEVRRGYPTVSPRPGWAEQDARLVAELRALGRARRGRPALGAGDASGRSASPGSARRSSLVDVRGRPVGPGLIYRDNRAVAEADELRGAVGDAAIHARTGHLPAAFHVGPKLLWLRAPRPDGLRPRRARVLQPRDLVASWP